MAQVSITLRRLELADLDAIERIERASYPTPWSRSMFASELAKQSSRSIAAITSAGELVGYLVLSRYVDAWHVMNVAVDPGHRRQGIASAMLGRLFELTRDDAERGYTLEVRVSNLAAISLYEQFGFTSSGVRRGYYTDNREDAVIMWRTAEVPNQTGGTERARSRRGADRAEGDDVEVILGIETSCDETAAALVTSEGEVRSSIVASQAELHAQYGGVVPEVASRRHLELVGPVVRQALADAQVSLDDVTRVAVTQGPGLVGALLVGLSAAKAIAWSRGIPLVPVDHLQGHVASLYLGEAPVEPPFVCLLASGGHTLLLAVRERGAFERLGTTLDDAAGEAFDKGARLLGLPYPGGAAIDALARQGDPEAFSFPIARVPGLDFSFSGVKTSLLYTVRDLGAAAAARRADLAASYQRAIVAALTTRLRQAADGDGDRSDRRRRRRGRELGAARRSPGRGTRAALAVHRQCRHDRVGRTLRPTSAASRCARSRRVCLGCVTP